MLSTPLRGFLWNGFTEVVCGSAKVENRLENSVVKCSQEESTQRLQGLEVVWKSDIFTASNREECQKNMSTMLCLCTNAEMHTAWAVVFT